ncbi:MAG: STAS domain-containing protein [Spirochaetota bacterium]
MELSTKKEGDIIIIYLEGRLEVNVTLEIETQVNTVMENNPDSHILFDLRSVEHMSSSGIRLFVATSRILKASKRRLVICGMNSAVKKIFSIVELMDMFAIYEDEDKALASFKRS